MPRISRAVLLIGFLATAPCAWGADIAATVAKITGKAQIQRGSDWAPLSPGQQLAPGDTVSTGFRSELQLQIGPSVVTVKALSRLTLQGLSQKGTSVQTDLYLKVGKVDAEVNKSEAVQSQKFKVSSPVATASVRGTAFSFDGVRLEVFRGLVDFSDLRGNTVMVPIGESARAALPGTRPGVTTNQALVSQASVVSSPAATGGTSSADEVEVSFNGMDYTDILNSLYGVDWYGGGAISEFNVYGIIPLPIPALTHLSVGGITAIALPVPAHVSVGGITLQTNVPAIHVTLGGIQ